jgi:hypothetical protein
MLTIEKFTSWCEMYDLPAPVRSRNNRYRLNLKCRPGVDQASLRSLERFMTENRCWDQYGRLPRVNTGQTVKWRRTTQVVLDEQGQVQRLVEFQFLFPHPDHQHRPM